MSKEFQYFEKGDVVRHLSRGYEGIILGISRFNKQPVGYVGPATVLPAQYEVDIKDTGVRGIWSHPYLVLVKRESVNDDLDNWI